MSFTKLLKEAEDFKDFAEKAMPYFEELDNVINDDIPALKNDWNSFKTDYEKDKETLEKQYGAAKYDISSLSKRVTDGFRKESAPNQPTQTGDDVADNAIDKLSHMFENQGVKK